MYGNFQADPGRLNAAIDEILGIVTYAETLGSNLESELPPYSDWMGVDDEYALKAGPPYRQNIASVIATHEQIVRGLREVVNVHLGQLRQIGSTQGGVLDSIDEGIRATTSFDFDQDGGKR